MDQKLFLYRTQFVQINDNRSPEQIIRCVVSQGPILGPLFFILCLNDLPKTTRLAECLLFADDASIFYSNSDPEHVASVVNSELTKISLERFSFECRKVIGFTFTTLRDWLKRFVPLFHPIRSKIKTNCDALACRFPALCVSYM